VSRSPVSSVGDDDEYFIIVKDAAPRSA